MRKLMVALLLLGPAGAFAAPPPAKEAPKAEAKEEKDPFKLIKADELAALQAKKDSKVVVLDANGPEFRAKEGMIPGAKALSSFKDYDLAKELPAAKGTPLVFYCANSH